MFNKLENIIKNIEGNVLVIGLDSKLIDTFNKNSKVNLLSIESNNNPSLFKKKYKKKTNKGKNINIKHLKRYLNKKSVDYLFINMNEMIKYYKYIIKDSVYLNNKLLYIYAENNIDKEFIIDKYNRYNTKIASTDYKSGFIITIDNSNSKNNFVKDKIYFIKDTLYNIAETIGNILVS